MRETTPPEVRFRRKVVPLTDGCWLWIGSTTPSGYGEFFIGAAYNKSRRQPAHRWSYEHHVGPIPEGLQLDHLCRERLCVNPEHLEPVTQAENIRRGAAAITHCPQGHPYSPENTYTSPNRGDRQCRTCLRARNYAAWKRLQDKALSNQVTIREARFL